LTRLKPQTIINDLRHLVYSSAEEFGDKALYIYKEDKGEKTFTYNDRLTYMNRLGTAFAEIGLLGKNVAVIGETHPYYAVTYLTVVNGNGIIIPLDKEITEDEIINFINISEASAIAYTESFNKKLIKFAEKVPNVQYFIPFYPATEDLTNPKVKPIGDLFEMGKISLEHGNRKYLDIELDMKKMCSLLFTSGTTGTSKGVMLSQHNLTSNTNDACKATPYDYTSTFVSVLPIHHSYEMLCSHLATTNLGTTTFINDSLKNVAKNIASFKPNSLVLVPLFAETMHKKIWSEIDKKGMRTKVELAMKLCEGLLTMGIDLRKKLFGQITDAFGGNLTSIICGGAPVSPQIIKDFYLFGIIILEGYGITECSPLVAVNGINKNRMKSVGPIVEQCEVKIDKKPDEITGEICVKGENVTSGYYKNEAATIDAFTDDGWFRTGDIGYVDEDGFLYITGRKKNIIILSNGKNIYPEEIEEYLSRCPLIKESIIVGRSNENNDIVITAIIHPDYENEALAGKSPEEIYDIIKSEVNEINKKLPVFKQVREIEIREIEFEKTTSKKIKRYKI